MDAGRGRDGRTIRLERASVCLERRLDIAHQIDNLYWEQTSLALLCECAYRQGDSEAVQRFGHRALALLAEPDRRSRSWRAVVLVFLGYTLADLGCLGDAADAYEQALVLSREPEDEHIDALAGLARVSLLQGNPAGALTYVEEVTGHLEARSAQKGYYDEQPFLDYLTCYHVLRANGDSCAWELLDTAHRLLQEQAAQISDEGSRRSFLENVAAHREIVALWEEASHP